MAITATALWIEGLATHEAQDYRRMLEGIFNFKQGIMKSGDFVVTTNNNMTITVGSGTGIVDGTEDANQGVYFVHADTSTVVSVDAAHATLNRFDLVVIRIRDNFYATGPTNAVDLFVVKGTPASSPAEPTVPANCLVLARLTVTANDTSIASGDIADRRTSTTGQGVASLKGAFRLCTASTRPTVNLQPYQDFIVESDTGRLLWYDGSIWRPFAHSYSATQSSYQTTTSLASTGATVTLPPGAWILMAKGEAADLIGNANSSWQLQLWDSTAGASLDTTDLFWINSITRRCFSLLVPFSNSVSKTIQLRAIHSVAGSNYVLASMKLVAMAVTVNN